MLKTQNATIIHESETQRQHVRLQVPATVIFSGQRHAVQDLSPAGLKVREIDIPFQKGRLVSFSLEIPFEYFALKMDLRGEVGYADIRKRLMGLRFIDITPRQVSLLNLILKSFMAGTMVTEGDIIAIAARDNFVRPRLSEIKPSPLIGKDYILRRILPAGLLALFCAGALYILVSNLYESLSVLKSSEGIVRVETLAVRASQSGTFHALIDANDGSYLTTGQKLGQIEGSFITGGPQPVSYTSEIKSPCDCRLESIGFVDGEYVQAGEPLFTLLPPEGQVWVEITLPSEQAQQIDITRDVRLKIAGERSSMPGRVVNIMVSPADSQQSIAKVEPEDPLDNVFAGRPVYAEFSKR